MALQTQTRIVFALAIVTLSVTPSEGHKAIIERRALLREEHSSAQAITKDDMERPIQRSNTRIMASTTSSEPSDASTRVSILLKICMWTSFAIFLLGILFDKLGGAQTIQMLQTFYFVVSIARDNPPLSYASMGQFRSINGYNELFADQESSTVNFGKAPSLPMALQLIKVGPYFPQNCNIMLWTHLAIWAAGGLFYAIGRFIDSEPCKAAARFILGPISFLLCLFNCVNVGFSIGLNLLYSTQVQQQSMGVQVFCWASMIISLVPPIMYCAIMLRGSSLLLPASLALKDDLLSRSHPVIVCWLRILSGLLFGVLSDFIYSFVVLLLLHIGYLIFVSIRQPFINTIMNSRSIVNESAIIAVLIILSTYTMINKADSASAQVVVWLLLLNVLMNTGMMLYPAARCVFGGSAAKKEELEATTENLRQQNNVRSLEGLNIELDVINQNKDQPVPQAIPEYVRLQSQISSHQDRQHAAKSQLRILNVLEASNAKQEETVRIVSSTSIPGIKTDRDSERVPIISNTKDLNSRESPSGNLNAELKKQLNPKKQPPLSKQDSPQDTPGSQGNPSEQRPAEKTVEKIREQPPKVHNPISSISIRHEQTPFHQSPIPEITQPIIEDAKTQTRQILASLKKEPKISIREELQQLSSQPLLLTKASQQKEISSNIKETLSSIQIDRPQDLRQETKIREQIVNKEVPSKHTKYRGETTKEKYEHTNVVEPKVNISLFRENSDNFTTEISMPVNDHSSSREDKHSVPFYPKNTKLKQTTEPAQLQGREAAQRYNPTTISSNRQIPLYNPVSRVRSEQSLPVKFVQLVKPSPERTNLNERRRSPPPRPPRLPPSPSHQQSSQPQEQTEKQRHRSLNFRLWRV